MAIVKERQCKNPTPSPTPQPALSSQTAPKNVDESPPPSPPSSPPPPTPPPSAFSSQTAPKCVNENSPFPPPPPPLAIDKKHCNCRIKENCVLQNQCKKGPLIYRAKIKNNQGLVHTYIGCTEDFKKRHSNHKASFKNEKLKNVTALSKFVWENDLGPEPCIQWNIEKFATAYQKGSRYCDLCLSEKLIILKESVNDRCLNRRFELNEKCVHKIKYRLKNV